METGVTQEEMQVQTPPVVGEGWPQQPLTMRNVSKNIDYEKCFKNAFIFKGELSEFCFVGLFVPWVTVLPSVIGNVTQKVEANVSALWYW